MAEMDVKVEIKKENSEYGDEEEDENGWESNDENESKDSPSSSKKSSPKKRGRGKETVLEFGSDLPQIVLVESVSSRYQETILLAARDGYTKVVESLIDIGVNVNTKDQCDSTPLHQVIHTLYIQPLLEIWLLYLKTIAKTIRLWLIS